MKFSYKKMVLKGVRVLVLFAVPLAINEFVVQYPEWAQLSLGTLLVMGANYLKVAVGVKYL